MDIMLMYVDPLDLFRGWDRRRARCRWKEGGSPRPFNWSSCCRVNFINNIKRKTYESWTRAVEWIEFGFQMEKEERFVRVRFLLSGLEFVVCFFLLLFPFAYGFVRIHARTWEMRERRKRKETRTENKWRKRNSKFNQSMTGTRFNDIHVEGGKDRNKMINRRLSYLFYPLSFRASLFKCLLDDETFHRDPVHHDMVIFVSFSRLSSGFLFLFFRFSSWTSIFTRSFVFYFALPPIPQVMYASLLLSFLFSIHNYSLSLYKTIDQSIQYIAIAIAIWL